MQVSELPNSLLGGAKRLQRAIFEQFDSTGQLSVKRRAVRDRANEAGVQLLNIQMTGIQWSLSTQPKTGRHGKESSGGS